MVYVGSSLIPTTPAKAGSLCWYKRVYEGVVARRFHNHLVTGLNSNIALQEAITQHGLDNFVAYVLEIVVFPASLTFGEKQAFLRAVEQKHIDNFPKAQLYNNINAKSKS